MPKQSLFDPKRSPANTEDLSKLIFVLIVSNKGNGKQGQILHLFKSLVVGAKKKKKVS